jgi:hypothetical protein
MKRGFPIELVLLGALLTVGAFSWLYFGNVAGNSAAIYMPDQLSALPRTDYRTGTQALAEFKNLHGKQFPLTS